MSIPFDILRVEPNDVVLWLGAAETLEDAKKRIHEIGTGQYLIMNQNTGNKINIIVDGGLDT